MNRKFEFVCNYGVLKKNLLGQYTNKVKEVLPVKTILQFDNEKLIVTLFGIDRNNGEGKHNEMNTFYYKNISRIEFLEDLCAMNIYEEEGSIDENGEEYQPSMINFFIDVEFVDDICQIFEDLANLGYFDLS